MRKAIIVYATREGHTRRIAEHLGDALRGLGFKVDLTNAREPHRVDLEAYDMAILAASVRLGKHEREMVRYARAHRDELARIPTTFVSVSMAQAGFEDAAAPAETRSRSQTEVRRAIDGFLTSTGWQPTRVLPVAGELAYTRYGALTRFIMKRIARGNGHSTDTSRDHDYTDWPRLDSFAKELAVGFER
jgi:menaquinone-dependent protoporphyrinogen oxidase